jgi:hypothetical protein
VRIRTIKPEFWGDEKLAPMDPLTRLVFLGLISMADDAGRLLDSVKLIDGVLFAHTEDSAREPLANLARAGRITRGLTSSGQRIIQINGWRHQKVDHPNLKSALPPIAQAVTEDSRDVREDGATESRDARASISTSTYDQRPTTSDPKGARERELIAPEPSELASLVDPLPPNARRILETFYEPAFTAKQRDRYRQIAVQLADTLRANHPGPKIRGGQRVKARSSEHLDDVCAAVLRDPPMERDVAIVFVLKRLLDPPKGPSVTEVAKREEQSRIQVEEQYSAAARQAGIVWANDHPAEYEPIRQLVEATYRGKSGAFADAAKQSELVQRCAKAAGFPAFDEWIRQTPHHAGAA